MAWTTSNQLLTRNGSEIIEYSPVQNGVHLGPAVHTAVLTHSETGLNNSGIGITNGKDGYIHATTGIGLQRFDPNNWVAPAQTLAGTVAGRGYGITTLPNGNIAYVTGSGTNEVYVYNPLSTVNTLIYTASGLIDDIEAYIMGPIALAGKGNNDITIINSLGTQLINFPTLADPNGLAFGNGVSSSSLYSNDNHGTITEYVFGLGYSSVPTLTNIIASGGSHGDLAAVGPDCAFYVSQFYNWWSSQFLAVRYELGQRHHQQ